MSNVEKAVKVTKTLNEGKIQSIASQLSAYETMGALYADAKGCQYFVTKLIDAGIIGDNEKAQYLKSDGTLNDTGKDFTETVLVGTILNEDNIRRLDRAGGKRIRQKLVRAILPLVENKGTGKEYSFNKELNEAVDIAVSVAKNHEKYPDVETYLAQDLMRSIKIRRIGDFDVSIETDSPYMERIEQGSPEIRMKEVPNWIKGKKSRVSKKGKPFLIIPFQWGTPNRSGGARAHFSNTISQSLYALIKKKSFKKSTQTGEIHIEKNWHGEDIQRAGYTWGDRVTFDDILDAAGDEGVSSNAVGMVRMLANSKSTYFTFRVISADSKAPWIRKAIPPNHVREAIEKSLREEVDDLIPEGLEQDLGLSS